MPLLIAAVAVAAGGTAFAGGAMLIEASVQGGAASRSHDPGTGGGVAQPTARNSGSADVVTATQVAPLRRIVPPDLLVVFPKGITRAQLAAMGRLPRVREMITADGGAIRLENRLTDVFGVDPGGFRSWTPPPTAVDEHIWAALAGNRFVLSDRAQGRLRLRPGRSYHMSGAVNATVTMGASAPLGVPGVDALVSRVTARVLGLVPDVAALINAPGADLHVLIGQVRGVLGASGQVIDLRTATAQLPVDSRVSSARPVTYLDLYKQSAARYCPGLSWTILAAIGQIESGHGANDGPSEAGALGPMQFLPSTWRIWGIPGFGDTTANIMNPYDAVPSAARYLCANGAASGGTSLQQAIFAYNHAGWYVQDVLALAQEYAQEFG